MEITVGKIINPGFDNMPETLYRPLLNDMPLNQMAENPDIAYLLGLERKYALGSNFAKMACRMLGIETIWAK